MKHVIRSHFPRLAAFAFALAMIAAPFVLATTAGPTNTLPRENIVGLNNAPTGKGLSTFPQIAVWVADGTGAPSTATSIASATPLVNDGHLTPTVHRGNLTCVSTTGLCVIGESGLYRADVKCNATALNGETVTLDAATTTDGSTFTEISGAQALYVALTGALKENLAATGVFSVTSAQASAGTFRIAARLSDSGGAANASCTNGNVLTVERLDTLQPMANP